MKNKRPLFVLVLSLMLVAGTSSIPQNSGDHETPNHAAGVTIFDNGVWWINKGSGPQIQSPMSVFVNGVNKGTTYLLEFGRRAGNVWPEIAAIYNTGYVRLAPPGLPFGTSFVLGPAYWNAGGVYVHAIQVSRVDIDTTSATPSGPIRLTIQAYDHPASNLAIIYEVVMPDPIVDATQMEVTEKFSVVKAFSLSTTRQASHEGFKWAQFSSMYVDDAQHDSDSAVYVDSNEKIRYLKFTNTGCDRSTFASPETLSALHPWVEVRHNDDFGINGNTPNAIIHINSAGLIGQTTPQGYITCSSDPNDDNVGAWINHDSAPLSFEVGDMGSISFTLISQDDPREPPTIFSDVLVSHWAWEHVERLARAGVTGGCGTGVYCPENEVTRAQMAVFLERGLHYPASFTAPDAAPTFSDTVGHWAEDWIEALKNDGITAGCAAGLYCPENPVTRAQMAVFLLKAKYGSSYTPPAVGSSTGFGDVPTTHWASAWIKQLAAEQITGGCGGGNYCPESPVTRAQMAVFLVKTFSLP